MLTLPEKLRIIRRAKGISLESLGADVGYSHAVLSNLENGKKDISPAKLSLIRVALNIWDMPLFEHEENSFKERLYLWYTAINLRQHKRAKELEASLVGIKHLPFATEMNLMYEIFRARSFLSENKCMKAREILDQIEPGDNPEILHHYHLNMGTIFSRQGAQGDALHHYLTALKLKKDSYHSNGWLEYNIANTYWHQGKLTKSTIFAEKALEVTAPPLLLEAALVNMLALNYICYGLFPKAMELMDSLLEKVVGNRDVKFAAMIHLSYGQLYIQKKDWNTALYYIDDALGGFEYGEKFYLDASYQRAVCLYELGNIPQCIATIAQAKKGIGERKVYHILFKALECRLDLEGDKNLEYIENEALPFFIKELPLEGLVYCKLLQQYYNTRPNRTMKKSLGLERVINNIYCNMLEPLA